MQTYPTYGEFQKAYKVYSPDSIELKDKVGSINPETQLVYVYNFGGYIEKLKDNSFLVEIENDSLCSENLEGLEWHLYHYLCDEKGKEPITKEPTSLDKLSDFLITFYDEEGLEHMCADDLLHTSWHDLDDYQRSTLSLFSQLFRVVAGEEGRS
jgi:hypothetical protein